MDNNAAWKLLPSPVLLYVFSLLDVPSQAACSLVCTLWNTVFHTTSLWKHNLHTDFPTVPSSTYKHTYKQLYLEAPVCECQVLRDHTDEVWHLCFSHDGTMFVSAGKDAQFIVWSTDSPSTVLHRRDMSLSGWEDCQMSEFNATDSLLMVVGYNRASQGKLALFDVNNDFVEIDSMTLTPCRVFGSWLHDDSFVTCPRQFYRRGIFTSPIVICDIADKKKIEIKDEIYKQLGHGVFYIKIANVPQNSVDIEGSRRKCLIFTSFKQQDHDLVSILNFRYLDSCNSSRDLEPTVDMLIDMNGFIAGFQLSPNHQYLAVNYRPFIKDSTTLSKDFEIQLIDLVSFKKVDKTLKSHVACSPSSDPFSIDVCVSDDFVCCGSEDGHSYLWERIHLSCVYRYPHAGNVNSVAFSPNHQGLLLTASDDKTIKIWRSRQLLNELKQQFKHYNHAQRMS